MKAEVLVKFVDDLARAAIDSEPFHGLDQDPWVQRLSQLFRWQCLVATSCKDHDGHECTPCHNCPEGER